MAVEKISIEDKIINPDKGERRSQFWAEDFNEIKRAVNQVIDDAGSRVKKVSGKGLSTNDYSQEDKQKLENLTKEQVLTLTPVGSSPVLYHTGEFEALTGDNLVSFTVLPSDENRTDITVPNSEKSYFVYLTIWHEGTQDFSLRLRNSDIDFINVTNPANNPYYGILLFGNTVQEQKRLHVVTLFYHEKGGQKYCEVEYKSNPSHL